MSNVNPRMSWLSNLAKQGEAFLDNLDQQAGAAIDNVEKQVVQKVREKRDGNPSPGMGMDRGIPRRSGISRPEWSPHHSRSSSRDKRIERGNADSPSLRDTSLRDSPILNRSVSISSSKGLYSKIRHNRLKQSCLFCGISQKIPLDLLKKT